MNAVDEPRALRCAAILTKTATRRPKEVDGRDRWRRENRAERTAKDDLVELRAQTFAVGSGLIDGLGGRGSCATVYCVRRGVAGVVYVGGLRSRGRGKVKEF